MTATTNDSDLRIGRHRLAIWSGAAALMALPVIALRAVEGTGWDAGDFVFLALLLAGTGAAYELAARVGRASAYRVAVGLALAAAMLSTWINLAVGIIGNEENPANLIYYAIPGVAIAGTFLARLRPKEMAYAMAATAAAQVLVFFAALLAGLGFTGPITVFFTALWLASGSLFRRAARNQPQAAIG